MQLPIFPPFVLVTLVVFASCLLCIGIGILLTSAKFKKRKFAKAGIITTVIIVSVISLYFLFYTISNIVGRDSVNTMWGQIEAAGLTTNPDNIIPRNPNYYWQNKSKVIFTDTRNISDNAVPLYEAAIALIKNSDVSNKRFEIFWRNRSRANKGYATPLYNKTQYNVSSWPDKDRKNAVKLSKNEDVRQAFACLSRGNRKAYAVNLRYYTDIDTDITALLPRLNQYREIFRMISFVSECRALEGKLDEAYQLTLDGFNFIHQFRNDPFIISHLVYIACTWIDLRALNSLVSRYGIGNSEAQKIIEALSNLDCNKSMQKGLHGDLILCIRSSFKERMTGEKHYIQSVFGKERVFADYVYLYPFNYQEYASYLEFWLKNYELYEKPYWKIKSQLEKLKKEKAQFLMIKRVSDYLFSYRIKTARTNSLSAATKVILALHIYKNKYGKFPEKLDALTPAILKKIAVDPLSGKTYNYKREGKSFKLNGFYASGGK